MLRPAATDAISTSQSTKLANPVLPTATLWAIKSHSLPWQMTGVTGAVDSVKAQAGSSEVPADQSGWI